MKKIMVTTNSEEETQKWGSEFAKQLKPGDCIALNGNLGAGKTVLSRGICRGLGYKGDVHSPSYSLVHEYPNKPVIYHLDLYRLNPGADFDEIGVEYYGFNEGITLIEWPERLEELNVGINYHINFEKLSDTQRRISIEKI